MWLRSLLLYPLSYRGTHTSLQMSKKNVIYSNDFFLWWSFTTKFESNSSVRAERSSSRQKNQFFSVAKNLGGEIRKNKAKGFLVGRAGVTRPQGWGLSFKS